ncbi:MAG: ATP synthase subunit I [Acidobacteriota bacterium]|nr:ATP synthase subunit I [Acidobacteriota bacterium]
MMDPEFFGERAQRRVERLTLVLGFVGAIAAIMLRGWPEAAAVVLGAVAGWLNFRWLRQFVGWVARISLAQAGEEKPKMPRRIFWQMFGRYALLGLVLYVMLLRFYWPVVAFLFGLFALFAAVLLEVIGELVFGTRGGMPA